MKTAPVWVIDENQVNIDQPLRFSACLVKQIIVRFPPIPHAYWLSSRFCTWYDARKAALEAYIAEHTHLPDAPAISLEMGSRPSLITAVTSSSQGKAS